MKEIIENLMLSVVAAAVLTGLPVLARSQYRMPVPPEKPATLKHEPDTERPPLPMIRGGDTSEKSIKADGAVKLTLCVTQGTVKVNGWNRKEVRVYVENGNKFNFNVREKDERTGDPNWITVMGVGAKGRYSATSECIWGGDIEIDLPVNASISMTGTETTTTIDSVRKVEISTVGGSMALRNVTAGITASARQGDVTVENSTGPMMLESTTGNIVVFEAAPGEIGDPFKARTNSGTISLQSVQHRQIGVGSTSGSVLYSGNIRAGGSYNLSTLKGSIRLAIPGDSAGNIWATFGPGMFTTDLPIDIQTENKSQGPIMTIVGKYGKGGDATVKLTTNTGSISIRKL